MNKEARLSEGSKQKLQELEQYFARLGSRDICLAFSGGVDSGLLLKMAVDAASQNGSRVYAVTFDSRLHPSCDLEIARRVAEELGGIHRVIAIDPLEKEELRANPVDRCYLCKYELFLALRKFARSKKCSVILDGTNEDDMHVYRPGIRALKELDIQSPLASLHITKAQVKEIAGFYRISVANRPSTPCMATRIPYGQALDYDVLAGLAEGEAYLRSRIPGNIRLRLHGNIVRLETDKESFSQVLAGKEEIISRLKDLGFVYITLDLEGFRSGSMDIPIQSGSGSLNSKKGGLAEWDSL